MRALSVSLCATHSPSPSTFTPPPPSPRGRVGKLQEQVLAAREDLPETARPDASTASPKLTCVCVSVFGVGVGGVRSFRNSSEKSPGHCRTSISRKQEGKGWGGGGGGGG